MARNLDSRHRTTLYGRPSTRVAITLLAMLIGMSLGGAGCSLPRCPSEPDGVPVRVSQQAAQRLQGRVEQISSAARNDFALDMTDEEATSYLALNLGQTAITDAQVRFLDGKVRLYARVAHILNVPVDTMWTAQVVDGRVRVKIVSASISCVPVPTQLLDSLSGTLNQMILESQVSVQVNSIKLEAGRAEVSGTRTK